MPDEKLARAIHCRVRRNILSLLSKNPKLSVHHIAEKLKITESAASKNLKLLYYLGLIDSVDKPPEKFYYIKIEEVKQLLEGYNVVVKKMG